MAITLGSALAAPPAAAQVSVETGGERQDVPANTVRTVTMVNGRTSIVDAAWRGGEATPGLAAITTTETTDEDEEGHVLSRTLVTRIEPQRATVVLLSYAPPPPAPRIEIDAGYLDEPVALGTPRVMRIDRDSWGGHFVASLVVNGVPVRAIIDTGSAYSILSADDARATGADRAVHREETAIGIGGYTLVGVARVTSVEIGGQSLGRLTMRIGQPGMPYTLLGQSEIARLGRVTIEDGVMTITPRGVATQVAMK
ncbi:retropepsin-like aspartic protease family protein [Sphingomonas prati]|uniref:Clan AA aspartic protease (TIGR02281 family) n=1 Tax=Sphingomonas prati TaxID=1843237 RepID=A0A7W9BVG2_9SPHN|nr:retropepsin-like aspartic protease [Sphingomonas prati]MBB5730857.1 clan AA aspartic protease (TIGR02281 family) [Sphingomonas prati]